MRVLILSGVSLGVGVLIGAVGIGGVLLIPALAGITGLPTREAMATALLTFLFTGGLGTFLFQRYGSIDWRLTAPVCVGAGSAAFLGAWANSRIQVSALEVALSVTIILSGVYTLRSWHRPRVVLEQYPAAQTALLLRIGAVSGFGSGLTGFGGPVVSVPIMVALGFPILPTIGASQVVQIFAALSGTFGNLQYGVINFKTGALVVTLEAVGVVIGVRIGHAANLQLVRCFVGALCVVVGSGLLARSLGIL
jgi:uncharacterized membrane protein YfcA